jgi:hypothetical protein
MSLLIRFIVENLGNFFDLSVGFRSQKRNCGLKTSVAFKRGIENPTKYYRAD